MEGDVFIAVDLGAGSGRVFLAGFPEDDLLFEEVARFRYPPRKHAGALRWDFESIFRDVSEGIARAGSAARRIGATVRSIGIDSWAVDYGLIDASGRLVEDPICYRDDRTLGMMDAVAERVPRAEIFARTGIQFLPFNTIYQLAAHVTTGGIDEAVTMLLVPDLIGFRLTCRRVAEHTNASTTQLVHAQSGTWDRELAERCGIPTRLLPEIVRAGTDLGPLTACVGERLGLPSVRLVATATHDTASAVAGTPLEDGWAYISSGTWSLVGVERQHPLIDARVEAANFTNEGGAFGTTRLLKNVMGLWILESCRREWSERGLPIDYDTLLGDDTSFAGAYIFPDDPRFLNPASMLVEIERQLTETGQSMPETPAAVARVVVESLAMRYASIVRSLEGLTGEPIAGIRIVGGGSRNDELNQAAATAAGLPVVAGPDEATGIGNGIVQSVAAGRFGSLAEAREYLRERVASRAFAPRRSDDWPERAERYRLLEQRYGNGHR